MTAEQLVYDTLDNLNITYDVYHHPPLYTINDAKKITGFITAKGCKNLFLKNKKGTNHYLVIMDEDKKIDLKSLGYNLGCGRLSFASEERLMKYLGLKPGSVSPFGLLNDINKEVIVLIDESLRNANSLSFHPNINTITLTITYNDFEYFLKHQGNEFKLINLD